MLKHKAQESTEGSSETDKAFRNGLSPAETFWMAREGSAGSSECWLGGCCSHLAKGRSFHRGSAD